MPHGATSYYFQYNVKKIFQALSALNNHGIKRRRLPNGRWVAVMPVPEVDGIFDYAIVLETL